MATDSDFPIDSPDPSTPQSWTGQLDLEFSRRAEKTILSRTFAQAPLKVQRPFYPEDPAICHVVALHTAGGMVGGDRLYLNSTVQPHSQALLTTAAATKIYRSECHAAQQMIHFNLLDQTCLEWLPQETILFDQAHYRQRLRVDLAESATWMGWDIVRLGRSARGEKFTAGHWRSHLEVWRGNRLLWVDPQWLQGGTAMMESLSGLAGCPVVGSFAMVGREVDGALLEQIRASWRPGVEIGVTRLKSGLLCRYRGHSTVEAKQELMRVWGLVRQVCCDRAACIPRVWQV